MLTAVSPDAVFHHPPASHAHHNTGLTNYSAIPKVIVTSSSIVPNANYVYSSSTCITSPVVVPRSSERKQPLRPYSPPPAVTHRPKHQLKAISPNRLKQLKPSPKSNCSPVGSKIIVNNYNPLPSSKAKGVVPSVSLKLSHDFSTESDIRYNIPSQNNRAITPLSNFNLDSVAKPQHLTPLYREATSNDNDSQTYVVISNGPQQNGESVFFVQPSGSIISDGVSAATSTPTILSMTSSRVASSPVRLTPLTTSRNTSLAPIRTPTPILPKPVANLRSSFGTRRFARESSIEAIHSIEKTLSDSVMKFRQNQSSAVAVVPQKPPKSFRIENGVVTFNGCSQVKDQSLCSGTPSPDVTLTVMDNISAETNKVRPSNFTTKLPLSLDSDFIGFSDVTLSPLESEPTLDDMFDTVTSDLPNSALTL